MPNRIYNFNPGPAALPLPVLEKAQSELLNYRHSGMSVMEMSHRSRVFEELIHHTEDLFKELTGIGDDYRVLFLQGGASLQFNMVPLNFLGPGQTADYIITGSFAEKAYKEAGKNGKVRAAATTGVENFVRIPRPEELQLDKSACYVHITTNNTIFGTQWHYIPDTGEVPLVADMSSDILSRPFDYSRFALVYAGAQKNLGPSGLTLLLIRKDLLDRVPPELPSMLRYDIHAENDSLYNTPPTFGVYMVSLVLEWIKEKGGLAAMGDHNREKASIIYDAIDAGASFYRGHAQKDSRSFMNITFRLPDEELENLFVSEASGLGLGGLKGHRSVGGIRASIYNAMSREGCEKLAQFMDDFRRRNG